MLQSIKKLYGHKLAATDGDIGHVKDFYFDDRNWVVRYIVADTGGWLPGRKVLLTPHSLGRPDQNGKALPVNLTREQIEKSPSVESRQPVSRQHEEEYYRYYGWPLYWEGDGLWGMSAFPILEPPAASLPREPALLSDGSPASAAAHLRSALAVNGYHITGSDGTIGHIADFMMDDKNWTIQQLVVKVGHRLSGNEVRIPTSAVGRISYDESTVFVNLTIEAIEHSPLHAAELVGAAG